MNRIMDISRPESEPQQPQRQGESRRLALWARRNKSWAKVIMVLLLAVIGPAVAAIILANLQTGPGEGGIESAKEKEKAAEERLALAESANRRLQRESLLERLERLRLTPHSTSWNASKCWSDQAWDLVSQGAALGIDDDLRNQAAATLIGIDARLVKPFREMAASSVVFDAQGKHLLIGGTPPYQQYPAEGAKDWDSETKVVLHVSNLKEAGPVAFGPDSVPLQLVVREGPSLLLWNVAKQEAVAKFAFDPEQGRVVQLALNAHRFPLLAMTADGSLVAAAGITADQNGVIAVWEGLSGKRLFQMPAPATALAFSADGKRLATGDEQGKITLWPVTEHGLLEYIQAGRLPIQCLAFSPDSRRLAAGDLGSMINIWKLGAKLPPTPCSGSFDGVFALAFSPDGTLLTSGGWGPAKLWDAATGRLLLQLGCEDFITGLAFTSDGHRLAVSSRSEFFPGGVSVWNLDSGRGIQTLRGLSAPGSRVCFSPDGRFVAALAHDWQVAIWNQETGQLVRLLDAPRGGGAMPTALAGHAWPRKAVAMAPLVGDAAGLAFSPDGKRFVLSAGTKAKSWDVATGRELGAWDLPHGSLDILAFHPTGKLLLFRIEAKDNHPVCLVRGLVEPKTAETVAEIKEPEISDARAPLDGSFVVVETKVKGKDEGSDRQSPLIEAFDPLSGRKIWPPPEMGKVEGKDPCVDPTGTVFAFRAKDKKIKLVEMPAGRLLEFTDRDLIALGPKGQLWVEPNRAQTPSRQGGYSLIRRGGATPVVTLGLDANLGRSPAASHSVQFNLAGTHLAWTSPDGTVTVGDLENIRKRLAEVGLGW